ncbi:MAG: RuvX/YqgF family protein [Patescibacteria group bacterium]
MRYLGIDYGSQKVGLAFLDETATIASPYSVWPNDNNLIRRLCELCRDRAIAGVVLDESLDYRRTLNAVMKQIHHFRDEFANTICLSVILHDEMLLSAEARRVAGHTREVDARVASLIL